MKNVSEGIADKVFTLEHGIHVSKTIDTFWIVNNSVFTDTHIYEDLYTQLQNLFGKS
uniref:Uncharacterized protein n=1 Tax=viral metagenome TaxID=1070528 RepID=A0A6M3X4M0_9ZZZZ